MSKRLLSRIWPGPALVAIISTGGPSYAQESNKLSMILRDNATAINLIDEQRPNRLKRSHEERPIELVLESELQRGIDRVIGALDAASETLSESGSSLRLQDGTNATLTQPDSIARSDANAPTAAQSIVTDVEQADKIQEIHFSRSSAILSPGAARKTALAARALLEATPRLIRLKGFSDTRGAADKNLKLSRLRAEAVADRLVAAGISRSLIEIVAEGEQNLPEPTPNNVDEPLNRCVGIMAVH